jgi:hypothetical protein
LFGRKLPAYSTLRNLAYLYNSPSLTIIFGVKQKDGLPVAFLRNRATEALEERFML